MITEEEKEIIEVLKHTLGYDAPHITQEQFENIVDYIMKNETEGGNPKELVWRLCGCYEGYNFNKVIDIFVDSRDAYYTSELVSYVKGNLDQGYLINKMIETKDLDFINNTMSTGTITKYLDDEHFEKIKSYYKSEKDKDEINN